VSLRVIGVKLYSQQQFFTKYAMGQAVK